MDASNLLKPALARGELHCIGATTLDEYRKHVEKDAALARRFQPIFVSEPTVEDTISILRGLKDQIRTASRRAHHRFRIGGRTTLSNRYKLTDRFLPDKAIDLMDEAAARLKMQVDSKPEELDSMDREIIRLKIEQEALKKESDPGSKKPAADAEKELAELEEKSAALTSRWSAEKNKLSNAQKLKSELERFCVSNSPTRSAAANSSARANWHMAGFPSWKKRLADIETKENPGEMMEEAVTANHIAQVVSRWTGVPVDKMLEGEKDKLLKMEGSLGQRVVGQAEAVRAGWRPPCAVPAPACRIRTARWLVHVLGPTGVGQDRADQGAGGVSVP